MAKNRKQKYKRQYEAERLQQRYNAVMTGLALFVLTIAPLVFRMVRLDFVSPAITNTTTADTGVMNDVFTHYKAQIYYVLSIALVVIFTARLLTIEDSSFRLTRYDAALAALCVFLLLSSIVSEYRVVAFNGFVYMLDGTVEHICYCLLFFFGFHVFSKSSLKKWFYVPLYACGLINALIALLNFTGVNMIDNPIIKTVLGVPANAVATNARAFTSTFGNANYLSGFGGVLFAVFFAKLMFSAPSFRPGNNVADGAPDGAPDVSRSADTKGAQLRSSNVKNVKDTTSRHTTGKPAGDASASRRPDKTAQRKGFLEQFDRSALLQNALSMLMVAASFSIIVTSLSSSGFLTFVIMAPIIIIFAALCGMTRRKVALAAASLAVCALILVSLASVNKTVFDETFGMFNMFADATDAALPVGSDGSGATLAAGAQSDSVQSDDEQLKNVKLIGLQSAGKQSTGADTGFYIPAIRLDGDTILSDVQLDDAGTSFCAPTMLLDGGAIPVGIASYDSLVHVGSDSVMLLIAESSAAALIAESFDAAAPLAGFNLPPYFPESSVSPGTGRLYIWVETLRLITRRPFIGYGMDTLSYAFPQNNIDKIAGLGSYNIYVTKPHNIYIGYAYGAGIPALLAFLSLNAFAAAAFLRWFFARRAAGETPDIMIMCAFLGWAAYLVQAFVNDDLISTAPLWWALFGVGAGLLRQASRADEK